MYNMNLNVTNIFGLLCYTDAGLPIVGKGKGKGMVMMGEAVHLWRQKI